MAKKKIEAHPQGGMLQISVLESDWGEADRNDIQVLLKDVASHIVRELRYPFNRTIRVVNLPTQDTPRAFYRGLGDVAYKVNLTVKDRMWSQFAYQFAHEFLPRSLRSRTVAKQSEQMAPRSDLRGRLDIRATPDGGTVAH